MGADAIVRDIRATRNRVLRTAAKLIQKQHPLRPSNLLLGAGPLVVGGLLGLSRVQRMAALRTSLQTAFKPYKNTTVIGHALSKHAQRSPGRWGRLRGNPSTWHAQAMRHYREIVRGPGDFKKSGLWFEKRLPDGRGIRLNRDYGFKGFLDPRTGGAK